MGNAQSQSQQRAMEGQLHPLSINVLPPEIWEHIFQYLPLKSLCAAAQTCQYLYGIRWPNISLVGQRFPVTDERLQYIMTKMPKEVRLSNCPRLTPLWPAILISCPALQHLRIHGINISQTNMEHLSRGLVALYGQLRELSLRRCSIDDEAAAVLAECMQEAPSCNMQVLTLSENNITALGIVHILRAATTIVKLNVSANPLKSEGAAHLGRYLGTSKIKVLSVDQAEIGNSGLECIAKALRSNVYLEELSLAENAIDFRGMHRLAEALEANSCLKRLDLHSNLLECDGAVLISSGLKKNHSLKTLTLWDNRIGPTGSKALATMLRANTTLDCLQMRFNSVGPVGTIELARALAVNSSLRTLDLSYCIAGDAGAAALGLALEANKTLVSLSLEDSDVGDAGASRLGQALARNASLRRLQLSGNRISDVGAGGIAAGLAANTTLLVLELRSCRGACLGPRGAGILARSLRVSGGLQSLRLENNALTTQLHSQLFADTHCTVRLEANVRLRVPTSSKRRRSFLSLFTN